MFVGDNRAEVAHGFRANVGGDFSRHGMAHATDVAGKKTSCPGISRSVGINCVGYCDGFDAVQFVTFCDPSAVFTDFYRGDDTFPCESSGE